MKNIFGIKNSFFKLTGKAKGMNIALSIGVVFSGLMAAPFAVDIPSYYVVHQQLQNAVDAGALAGASQLPNGQAAAETAAYDVASKNLVDGKTLQPSDLSYSYTGNKMTVSATVPMQSFTAGIFNALNAHNAPSQQNNTSNNLTYSAGNTTFTWTVNAGASAEPAARDTILVIDTSSSMGEVSNGQTLLSSVKSAANGYVNYVIASSNKDVDRIGLVDFNQTARLDVGLTSTTDSPNFSSVQNGISNLQMFRGFGWNTYSESGLQAALDEMQAHGRSYANKQIIFMTDGNANLPGSPADYSYSQSAPYSKCTDMVNHSTQVQSLCTTTKYFGRQYKMCPALPSSQITDDLISDQAQQCGQDYVNYMTSVTDAQSDRAKQMGVSITTIRIYNSSTYDTSWRVLQRLIKDPNWTPDALLTYMADTTGGQQYTAEYYDPTGIDQIYSQIAQKIQVKLTQ